MSRRVMHRPDWPDEDICHAHYFGIWMLLKNRADEIVLHEVHECMAKVCAASRKQAVYLIFVILLDLSHTDVTILCPNEHDSTA